MSTWRVYFSRLRAILVGALSEVFLSLVADIYKKAHVPSKLHTENFLHRLFPYLLTSHLVMPSTD